MVTGEDTHWNWLPVRRYFHKRVGYLIEAPWDVIEFEAIEFVLQPSDFLAVCSHLGVVIARLLHDLVDDQLGVTPDVQLDGNA